MLKIDSFGNEKIADALLQDTIEEITQGYKNKEPVFACCKKQSIVSGNTIDILATVCVGLDSIFKEVENRLGKTAADSLCIGFAKSLISTRQKNS